VAGREKDPEAIVCRTELETDCNMVLVRHLRPSHPDIAVTWVSTPARRERRGIRYLPVALAKLRRWPDPSHSDRHYWRWVFQERENAPGAEEMIAGLLENQREICEMRYRDDIPAEEIAEKLNLTKRAISRTLNRAKNRMREIRLKMLIDGEVLDTRAKRSRPLVVQLTKILSWAKTRSLGPLVSVATKFRQWEGTTAAMIL
jgi:predicted DNA-binding protein YlxM (UPF0122 family)